MSTGMQRGAINGLDPTEIYHRIVGNDSTKIPLVFLHGLMGFAANWGKIWPHFESNYKVLVFDQRGHGRSTKPQTGYSPEEYAADLHELLSFLGWERAHIIGHSMGGRVALQFAHNYPEQTASLTMEDSGAEANPSRVHWITNLLGKIPTPFPDREAAKKFFTTEFKDDPMTGSFLHANLETLADQTLNWRFHAPGMIETVEKGRAQDATKIFQDLQIPILLVRGGKSVEFPANEATRMEKLNSRAKLVTIPGAGHYVHAEKPTEFSAALSAFLQEVDRAQP